MIFFEAIFINFSLCLDAFVLGVAYGTEKIRIPLFSLLVINILCSGLLALSLLLGRFVGGFLSFEVARWLSFSLLAGIGIVKLLGHFNALKNPCEADRDNSRHISLGEAAALAFALSVDGLAVGFGAGLSTAAMWWIIGLSLVTDPVAIVGGKVLGEKLQKAAKINLGFLSGVILIVMGILRVWKGN